MSTSEGIRQPSGADNGELDRLQSVILDILRHIVELCDANDFPYWMVEGSCLGALRHNGIIPWDDDIDIAIPATRHSDFVEMVNSVPDARYRALPAFTSNGEELVRVVDTALEISGGLHETAVFEHPMIDVFLVCGMPKGSAARALHYRSIWMAHKLYKLADPSMILVRDRGLVGNAVSACARRFIKGGPEQRGRALKRLEKAMCRYPLESGTYAYCITWYGQREIVPSDWYGAGRPCDFNGLTVQVPAEAELYLARLYNDWKQLPPEEERVGKHEVVIVEAAG